MKTKKIYSYKNATTCLSDVDGWRNEPSRMVYLSLFTCSFRNVCVYQRSKKRSTNLQKGSISNLSRYELEGKVFR